MINKIVKNYFYNLSYQILIVLIPLITTPYVSRVLGAKGVGTFSYTNSIVQYFILFGCIGLNLYGQREIAYVQHEQDNRDKVFWELVILRIVTVSISLVVYYLTFAHGKQYAATYKLMTLDILASMVDISWFFQGIEEFKKIVTRNFVVKIVGVILIFLFVKKSEDLYLYILFHSSTLLLGNLSMWVYVPRFVKRKHDWHGLNIKRHVKPTLVLFMPQIATSVYTVLDKTMIGVITGAEEEVAFYEQAQKIIKIALTLVTSLGTVMMPRVANLYKLHQMDTVKQYLMKSFRFVSLLSFPMMFGLMAISINLVPWFFGSGYEKVSLNMGVIAPIIVAMSTSGIIGSQYLLPIGRQKEYTVSVLVGCGINCLLNLILIPYFLSIGAAVASVVAELSVTGVQIYFTRRDFSYIVLFKENSKYFLTSVMMFIPVRMLAKWLHPSIINTLLLIVIGSAIYLFILILTKDEQVLMIATEIDKKLKIRKAI